MIALLVAAAFAEPLKVAPLAFFREHCQRCHGPQGSFYIPGFAEKRGKENLRDEIKSMAIGPGMTSISEADLDQQVLLHTALSSETPYVNWTAQNGPVLSGEKTPGKLVASANGVAIETRVKGQDWTCELPGGVEPKDVELTLTYGKKAVRLRLRDSALGK